MMKKILFIVSLVFSSTIFAWAIPPGSYLGNCHDAYLSENTTLSAICKNKNGNDHITSLTSLQYCKTDITVDNNGDLQCDRRKISVDGDRNFFCHIDGSSLLCEKDDDMFELIIYRATMENYLQCQFNIKVFNEKLVCVE